MQKQIYRILLIILFLILFIICLSPAALVRFITGNVDSELHDLYWARRMQAMGLFVGVGLIIGGLQIIKRGKMAVKFSSFVKTKQIALTGKNAFISGIFITAIGALATFWSLSFWYTYVIPAILQK